MTMRTLRYASVAIVGIASLVVLVGCSSSGTTAPSALSLAKGTADVGDLAFAPYADVTLTTPTVTAANMAASGVTDFTLAFVTGAGGKCAPAWGSGTAREATNAASAMQVIRDNGGQFIVSFGGAYAEISGMLDENCATVEDLAKAYVAIADAYWPTGTPRIDFDIEGGESQNTDINLMRAQALKYIQDGTLDGTRSYSTDIQFSYTLATNPDLGAADLGALVLKQVIGEGVHLASVNGMAMEYGNWYYDQQQPRNANMGTYAIDVAKAIQGQIKSMSAAAGRSLTDAEAWSMVRITPNIGENNGEIDDSAHGIFTLGNAATLRDFAAQKAEEGTPMGGLSMWSFDRDQPCTGTSTTVLEPISGELWTKPKADCVIAETQPYQFSSVFLGSAEPTDASP